MESLAITSRLAADDEPRHHNNVAASRDANLELINQNCDSAIISTRRPSTSIDVTLALPSLSQRTVPEEGQESSDEGEDPSSAKDVAGVTTETTNTAATPAWKTRSLQRKQKAAYLAAQYPPAKQRLDKAASFIYGFVMLRLFYNLFSSLSSAGSLAVLLASFVLAALWADLVSGMLHWACDTYGSVNTPVVGKLLIRSFREHHIDPMAITRHPFFETNGNSILATLPMAVALAFNPPTAASGTFHYALLCFLTSTTLLLSFTNQIHKWAHSHEPPRAIRVLQKMGVILESRAHQKHHFNPYDRDYCITTGWLNPILEKLGYWRTIEELIERFTGAVPRKDDQNWAQPGAAPKLE